MSNFVIYEDQENTAPTGLNELLKPKNAPSILQSRKTGFNVLQNKRTVLSTISVNSNIRVQPRRAAKQVTNSSSQILQDSSLSSHAGSKTKSCNSVTSFPSFSVYEDSSSFSALSSSGDSFTLQTEHNAKKDASDGKENVPRIKNVTSTNHAKTTSLSVSQVNIVSTDNHIKTKSLSSQVSSKINHALLPITSQSSNSDLFHNKNSNKEPISICAANKNPFSTISKPFSCDAGPLCTKPFSALPISTQSSIIQPTSKPLNVLQCNKNSFNLQNNINPFNNLKAFQPCLPKTGTIITAKDHIELQEQKEITRSTQKDVEGTPASMDISMGDFSRMAVDTPSAFVSKVTREHVLVKKQHDFWDVPEYSKDIYNYIRQAEVCHKPRPNYMLKQTDITASMRWILVDWLVEVAEEYNLGAETLYLAVSYIDRFLSHMSVKRDKLQLVGTTAMFIASKYEEIYPPDVSQFAYITDNTYRVAQIIRMEQLILKVLSFDMAVPTAFLFVNYFCNGAKSDEKTTHLAMFISELSMLDCDPFLRYLPSKIAAASLALANYTLGAEAWPASIALTSGYSVDDIKECYVNLHRSFCRVHEPTQHAIRDKYKSSKLSSVSSLSPKDKFFW